MESGAEYMLRLDEVENESWDDSDLGACTIAISPPAKLTIGQNPTDPLQH
jgi:hypothetical protein